MRHFIAGVAVTVFVVTMSVPAFAKTETVKGQLIDQECYLMEKKVEPDAACAVAVRKGRQAGRAAHLRRQGVPGDRRAGGEQEREASAHMLHTVGDHR